MRLLLLLFLLSSVAAKRSLLAKRGPSSGSFRRRLMKNSCGKDGCDATCVRTFCSPLYPSLPATSLTDTIARPTHWTDKCYPNPPKPFPWWVVPGCFLPAFDPSLALYDNVTEPHINLTSRVIAKTNHDQLGVTGEMSGYISVRILHTSPYSTRQPARCTVAALNLRRYACQRTDGSLSLTSLSLIPRYLRSGSASKGRTRQGCTALTSWTHAPHTPPKMRATR